MKAIVIDEPWIRLILSGEKIWEMRKGACNYRGPVALIRKGSGLVVGTANVVNSLPALESAEAYAAAEPHHRIPPARQVQARTDGWATPWVFAAAAPLATPVPYKHPHGAVIWVNLYPEAASRVASQVGQIADVPRPAPAGLATIVAQVPRAPMDAPSSSVAAQPADHADRRVVVITGSNLRNNHIYLPLEFFPADSIGGKNTDAKAPREISMRFQPGQIVQADIDGTKRILRSRAPVGDFLSRAGVEEGDKVVITRHSPYAYSITKHPAR